MGIYEIDPWQAINQAIDKLTNVLVHNQPIDSHSNLSNQPADRPHGSIVNTNTYIYIFFLAPTFWILDSIEHLYI
jgi:hypothetical protein